MTGIVGEDESYKVELARSDDGDDGTISLRVLCMNHLDTAARVEVVCPS